MIALKISLQNLNPLEICSCQFITSLLVLEENNCSNVNFVIRKLLIPDIEYVQEDINRSMVSLVKHSIMINHKSMDRLNKSAVVHAQYCLPRK